MAGATKACGAVPGFICRGKKDSEEKGVGRRANKGSKTHFQTVLYVSEGSSVGSRGCTVEHFFFSWTVVTLV